MLAACGLLALGACGTDSNSEGAGAGGITPPASASASGQCRSGDLSGAGSSFQDPMQQSWIKGYTSSCSGARINYQAVGSGAGIEQFGAGTVDFAGSDVTMQPDEAAAAKKRCGGNPAIHIPVTAGGAGITYNLPGVDGLKLSPDTLAAIFQGQITSWDDPQIKADNPGVRLPSMPVTVFHRSDSSGTNAVFTSYLAGASSKWKLGSGTTVNWPSSSIGKPQNQGVSAAVAQTKGGITYTEEAFAAEHKLPLALLRNAGGHYVSLTAAHVSTALASAKVAPAGPNDVSVNINYRPTSATAYPISTVSYAIVCSAYPSGFDKTALVKDYLSYTITDGQQVATKIGFAPLPQSLVGKDKSAIASISGT